jgi:hypothetical protein
MDISSFTLKKKAGSERADVLGQLYALYLAERTDRRKENWKRYCIYCKEVKMICPEKFKSVRDPKHLSFIRELTIRDFAVKLGHLKELKDLYYLLSCAKDRRNRGENISKYILGSVKSKNA